MATIPHRQNAARILQSRALGLYDKGEFDAAEASFLKIIDMCKCRAGQRQPCVLAEIIAAIANNDLKSALAKMTASCIRCDNSLHIDALDSLIATYEKQGRIDDAIQAAAKFVNLCPREPKAFLRLGKLLRLKQNPTMAYQTYKQGIDLVKRKHPNHPNLQGSNALGEHRDKVKALAKFDPLPLFPIELVRIILKLLDFRTQCRSLRVSKTWKTVLTSPDSRDIWQTQVYTMRPTDHPGLSRLRKTFQMYSEYAKNGTNNLTINYCSVFFQILKFPELLSYSKTLKVLQLREPYSFYYLNTSQHLATPPLTSLYLGEGVRPSSELLRTILMASADSLEELSLFELPPSNMDYGMWYRDWPRLEKLKVARLSWAKQEGQTINVGPFMELTPNLEEAWLDYVTYSPHELALQWPKLRSLFIGEHATSTVRGAQLDYEPFLNEDLRELHLEGRTLGHRIYIPHLEKLEKLSLLLHDDLTEQDFERIVRPSMESGTLRELDVRPLPHKIFFPNLLRPRPLPDWLQGNAIEYMSVSGPTPLGSNFYSNFETVLPDIIQRFPNLRTVDIGNDNVSDSVLAEWIRGGVRFVHHRAGDRRADLKEWAMKEYGAKLVDAPPRHIPSMRPDRGPVYNNLISTFQINYYPMISPR